MTILVRTLSDQIFDIVRDRVLSGAIPPGAVVRQEALAAELGVSKIPLREAMARLEQDGLLTSHPNRGFFVPQLSTAEAEEVFDLRLKVEPELAARGAILATTDERRSARAALKALNALRDPHAPEALSLNREFHLALLRPARRPVTTQVMERMHLLAERYVRVHLEPSGRESRAYDEHSELLRAWLDRDAEAVSAHTLAHIAGTLADLRAELPAE